MPLQDQCPTDRSDDGIARPGRRTVLAGAFGLVLAGAGFAGVSRAGAPIARAATGRSFYVDPAGDDAGDGLTTARPWRTLTRVNAAIAVGGIASGDTIRLRRGRTHFGILRPGQINGLTVESWGDDPEAPLVTTYTFVDQPSSWRALGDGRWSLDLQPRRAAELRNGYVSSWSTEIGFLRVDGVIHGDRKRTTAALTAPWQFVSSGSTLVVQCPENPSAGGRTVWMATAEPILEGRSGVTVRDLAFAGTGRNAVQTATSVPVQGFALNGCTISEVGGGYGSDGASRFGNGVQVWSGARDVDVVGNTISDCWDVGLTIQGPVPAQVSAFRDIVFENNTLHRNTQSFEYWSTGTRTAENDASTCTVRGNDCHDAGASWSANLRPDRLGKGTHLLFYRDDVHTQITIQGNTFDRATNNYLYANPGLPRGLVTRENSIRLDRATKLQFGAVETVMESSTWMRRTGLESGSRFFLA
jgi:hypothetical protein